MRSINEAQEYVNRAAAILGLAHWKVEVSKHPAESDSWADVEVSDNLWNATIRLSADFWALEANEKRRIVAHELIHIHYSGVERAVDALNGVLGTEAFTLLQNVFDVEAERAADALSTPLSRLLPHPDEHIA